MGELRGATERFLIAGDGAAVLSPRDMALSAAAAASAGALDLIEAARAEMPIGLNLVHREAAENLADALRSVLAIEVEEVTASEGVLSSGVIDHAKASGVLLAAVQEFLEGWVA